MRPPEARCKCGAPVVDHVLLRYFLRAWVGHHALQLLDWPAKAKRRVHRRTR